MASERLSFELFGVDVSASRALRGVGDAADKARDKLTAISKTSIKIGVVGGAGLEVLAQAGQWLSQVGPAAAVAAPALLTMAQGMGVLKLAGEGVSKQFEQLTPQIDGLRAIAAKEIHGGIQVLINSLKDDMPVVQQGVRETAAVLGGLAERFTAVFSGPAFRDDLGRLMESNATSLWNLGKAGISAAGAFWDIAVAATPVWENFTRLISVGAQQVATWIELKRNSGELAAAIKTGADNVGAFVSAIWNFGVGLHSIFGAMSDDSTNLSESLFNVSTAFKSWATSEETVNRIKMAMSDLKIYAAEAFAAIQAGFNGQVSDGGWTGVFEHLGSSAREFADFVTNDLWPTIQSLADLLTGPFGTALMSVADILHGLVFEALSTVLAIIRDDVVPAFRDNLAPILNDVVIPALRELASWVGDFLLPKIKDLADFIVSQLRPAFDSIKAAVDENKPQLEALGRVLLDLATGILTIVVPAIEMNFGTSIRVAGEVVSGLIFIIGGLVEAAAHLAVIMAEVALAVIAVFKQMFDAAASAVSGILGVWGLLPGPLGEPFRTASREVDIFKGNVDRDLTAAAGIARDTANSINGWLGGIHDKTVTLTVVTQQINKAAGMDLYDSRIPGNRWTGGPVLGGSPYVVGEKGAELFVPRTDGYILDASTTRGMRGGRTGSWGGGDGGGVAINVTVHVAGSVAAERDLAESIAGRVRDQITNSAASNGRRTGLPIGA